MLSVYPACFYKEENGYSVIFPDLNGLATCGETLEESMEMAVDCLAGYLYTCEKDGDNIPAPSTITDIDVVAVAEQISPGDPVGEAFVNMISVDVAAYAKEHFEKSVRKTLTIPAWLNSAALEQGINFSQTLQEALIGKLSSSQAR
jgi:predicted RNase H-like HicB family nuclease